MCRSSRRVGNRRRRATSPVAGGEGGGWYSVNFFELFYTYKTSSRLGGESLLVLQIADTNWWALPAFKASRQLELNTRATRRPCTDSGCIRPQHPASNCIGLLYAEVRPRAHASTAELVRDSRGSPASAPRRCRTRTGGRTARRCATSDGPYTRCT